MAFVFDHLFAVFLGAIVLMALMTIETRDRVAAMMQTTNAAATAQAMSVLNVTSQDLDNAMSETMAREELGTYRCELRRSADDQQTVYVEVPVYVRSEPGGPTTPAHVRYTLVPAGDSVRVGTRWLPQFDLRREVDTGAGYGAPQVVAHNLTDFEVAFRGRASSTTSGPPPLRFTGIAISLATALPGIERRGQDQINLTTENQARVGISVRPPNLTTGV